MYLFLLPLFICGIVLLRLLPLLACLLNKKTLSILSFSLYINFALIFVSPSHLFILTGFSCCVSGGVRFLAEVEWRQWCVRVWLWLFLLM